MLIHDRSIHQFESNWDISEIFWSTSQRTTWQLVNNKNQTSHTWLATLTVLIAKASFEQQWLYIPSHFRFGLRHFAREHIVLSLPSSSKKASLPESYIHFTTTGPTSKQSWVDWCFTWPKPFLESTGIDHLGVESWLPVHPWWKAYDVIIFDMQFAWKKKGHLLSISLPVGFFKRNSDEGIIVAYDSGSHIEATTSTLWHHDLLRNMRASENHMWIDWRMHSYMKVFSYSLLQCSHTKSRCFFSRDKHT